jgi:hypothetical protein
MKEQAAKGTHDKVKELINVLPVTGDALRVLEAPCGFGGMATFLNSKHYKVIAIDIIPPEKLDRKKGAWGQVLKYHFTVNALMLGL